MCVKFTELGGVNYYFGHHSKIVTVIDKNELTIKQS